MYSLYANDDNITYGVKKFIIDTEANVEELPTNVKPGSSALVLSNSSIWVFGFDEKWSKIKDNGNTNTFLEWNIL